MTAKIDIITLGVTDLDQARRFYEGSFGAVPRTGHGALMISLGNDSSRVFLRKWEDVASDAGVESISRGFRAFTLSYILESADAVDAVLARAERHGGRVSKPPKNAFWGYSAYITDPSGYLWKVASSKGRPLLGRRQSAASDGQAKPKEVPITIGVADMKRSKEFYRDGIGLPVKKAFGNKFVMFEGRDGTSDLGMYRRGALADDAAVPQEGSGFHGFSMTHVAQASEDVDALLGRAAEAGGQIVMPATEGGRGRGYFGYFADLDGNLWQEACRN